MSRVDERIQDELRRLDREVDASGVVDRLAGRKARRRNARRFQIAGLALAVVSGTVLGAYGLTRLIGPAGDLTPGESPDASVPTPADTMPPRTPEEICARKRLDADMNADGRMDWVEGWAMAPDCDSPEFGLEYWVHVNLSTGPLTGYGYTQHLPECEAPFDCRVLAAPDIDGDGRPEMAIRLDSGPFSRPLGLYRFNEEAESPPERALLRLQIAPPGDPWHERFGHAPGPTLLPDGDGEGGQRVHHLGCRTASGRSLLDVVTWLYDDGSDEWRMHRASFELRGSELVLWSTEDERLPYLGGLPAGTDPCITEVV
jgi:hypothetical protein